MPSWKQVFQIPFPFHEKKPFMYQRDNQPDSFIGITVFDMVEIDICKVGGYYNDETTIFEEKRYIGDLTLPLPSFGAHDLNPCINFIEYILNTPVVTFGYNYRNERKRVLNHHHNDNDNDNDDDNDDDEELQMDMTCNSDQYDRRKQIKIKMKVVIEPSIPSYDFKHPIMHLPCDERPELINHSKQWIHEFQDANKKHNRMASLFVSCSNGKKEFISNVLNPHAPPSNCETSLANCAHFVSLLPLLDKWKMLETMQQNIHVYYPMQQILNLTAGTWFSHALLLANYFLYFTEKQQRNSEVFLLFGDSIFDEKVVRVYLYFVIMPCINFILVLIINCSSFM